MTHYPIQLCHAYVNSFRISLNSIMSHVSTECLHNYYHKQDAKGNIDNDVLKMQPMTKYDTLPELHAVLYLILFYSQRKGNKMMFNSTVFSYDIV